MKGSKVIACCLSLSSFLVPQSESVAPQGLLAL